MSYRLNVVKRSPIAVWILDDTTPFQEHTGSGYTGTVASTPPTSSPLVAGAAWSSVLSPTNTATFQCPVFAQGQERKSFALAAWIYQTVPGKQRVLSHQTQYDGLWIEDKVINFTTTYLTAGSATCSYDMGERRAVYAVGIHTAKKNELWVDGVLVASVELTDDQKNDQYISTNGNLYSGSGAAGTALAINSVEIYNTISPADIMRNFIAGRNVMPQNSVPTQYKGIPFALDAAKGAVYFDTTWATQSDFNEGYGSSVNIEKEGLISPALDTSNLSVAGSWYNSVLLDVGGVSSAYGVLAEWSGSNITVEGSLDGTTWTALTNGALVSIITNGYTTTDKVLRVRVSFAAGLASGTAYLESLRLVGFANNAINSTQVRAITATYPAVPRGDYEPIEYREDNGINLHGGTLTLGLDTSADPNIMRTLEVWIKPLSGTPTISGAGTTKYRNGVSDSNPLPVGEWSLVHYPKSTDITTDITITGDCIVGQAALYPTTLAAADILQIWKSYTGFAIMPFTDDSVITISEVVNPVTMYIHDWSIDGGGG